MTPNPNDISFNGNDFECIVRLYNGVNDIQLRPEAWDDLYIEEDIFDWATKGSILLKSPHNTLERSSEDTIKLTGSDNTKLIYKFRGDGRDTIFISIYPKNDPAVTGNSIELPEALWRIEIEASIVDVEDYIHSNIPNKAKKIYFIEKTHQMMAEKNIEFSTATIGANKNKKDIHKLNNDERSLKTGEALGELILQDEDFKKHAKLYNTDKWDSGSDKNKVFYTSPSNHRFLDDLNYLSALHTSSDDTFNQPCILKLERPEQKNTPRQFSLLPIKSYFDKAGKSLTEPGEYQMEHFYLQEHSETIAQSGGIYLKKSPESSAMSVSKDVKGAEYSEIASYQLVDMVGKDYSNHLTNRVVCSYNTKDGQYNFECKDHSTENIKTYAQQNIIPNVVTKSTDDRIPLTNYITQGYNTQTIYTPRQTDIARFADGKNKLLKYYLFDNLGINFSLRGFTIRQPGRFFAISKRTTNDQDYDHLIEGQYLITNVVHYFSTTQVGYYTNMTGIKTHKYDDVAFTADDTIIIK